MIREAKAKQANELQVLVADGYGSMMMNEHGCTMCGTCSSSMGLMLACHALVIGPSPLLLLLHTSDDPNRCAHTDACRLLA